MSMQTLYILNLKGHSNPALLGLIFFSTLCIYALHRVMSVEKMDKALNVERFNVIAEYKSHILIYIIISIIGGGICFFYLKNSTQLALLIPAILSLAYVVPFLGIQKLRLRDLHFVKIFLIAIVWSYVTVILPLIEFEFLLEDQALGMIIDRFLFVFLITLPFDLRDWEIDKRNNVITIPAKIGVKNTLILIYLVLIIWLLLVWQIYTFNIALALTISGVSTGFFISFAPSQKHDYYFTALLDGTMIIQCLLIVLFCWF
jgi:4-hydroxybenzoate polyprenyltransferase